MIALVLAAAAGLQGSALAEGAPGAPPPPRQEAAASVESRLREIEAMLASLRAQIDHLRSNPGTTPEDQRIVDVERRIEALSAEIERLQIGEAAVPPEAAGSVGGLGPAASKVYRLKKGVSIGGYGEMLYQNYDARADNGIASAQTDRADFLRAVFYFGYKFSDRTLFNSEIEFEHAVAGEDGPGEVAVEFAYVDHRLSRRLGLRGGLLLVPVGFLNELHEPPIFHGARRPEVERLILPTTWRENGVGLYGEAGPVTWRAGLITSLDAAGFTPGKGIREGRQDGAEALAHDVAVTARVDYVPVAGLLLGVSAFSGDTGQGRAAAQDARYTLWDAHAEWNWRGLHVRALYARGILSDAEAVSLLVDSSGATAIGAHQRGGYGEIGWNILAPRGSTKQEIFPFLRYERLDTQDEVAPGFAADPANDRTIMTWGVTYRPIPNIAVKVDYQDFRNDAGTGIDQVNVALGYLF